MRKDLVGRKFGRLTVIERVGSDRYRNVKWSCLCACGKLTETITTSLLQGRAKSCGCLQVEASRKRLRKGRRFGRLVILRFSRIVNQRSMYICRCDCGQETEVQAHRLTQGYTISCGCYRKEVHTKHGLSGTKEYASWCASQRRARKIGNGGSHSLGDIYSLFARQKGRCYYCGEPLGKYHKDHKIPLSRGGSDDKENLCLACPSCNQKKHCKTDREFFKLMSLQEKV